MRSVGVRELKHRTSEILRTVRERGEDVAITFRGDVVARLVAVPRSKAAVRRRRAAWTTLDRLAAEISARWPKGVSAARAVSEARRG